VCSLTIKSQHTMKRPPSARTKQPCRMSAKPRNAMHSASSTCLTAAGLTTLRAPREGPVTGRGGRAEGSAACVRSAFE
jgi:hypothetical protein